MAIALPFNLGALPESLTYRSLALWVGVPLLLAVILVPVVTSLLRGNQMPVEGKVRLSQSRAALGRQAPD